MTSPRFQHFAAVAMLVLPLLWACEPGGSAASARTASQPHNQLSAAERAAGWELLFDGSTTEGWHVYGKESVSGWTVEGGALMARGHAADGGGDLVSDAQYGSFALQLEWKLSPEANSGIFFHVVEDPERYPAVHLTGPEYQLIDDEGFPQPLEEWQLTGANYAMHVASSRPTRPVGEWNHSRIVVDGGRVEHWLNGVRVVAYELWSEDWERRVRESKWAEAPGYGRAERGHIALQDHGGKVWFRNVKIRPLE